jgi:ubiquitin C-terminal hydrolase
MDLLELIFVLNLEYVDRQNGLFIEKRAAFSWMTTICDVTKQFLEIFNLDFVHTDNLNIVLIRLNQQHYSIPFHDANKTLYELNIENGSTLRFQSELTDSQEGLFHLTVWGPKKNEKIDYHWNEATTTLGMLLNNVVKAFHLESIKHERIRLVTISDTEIDLLKNSHVKLSRLGLQNDSTIWIKLLDFSLHENICVRIQCTNSDRTSVLYISPTNTIAELNKHIERCLLIVHELYTKTNAKLDFNDCLRTLEQLGVQSGQIIYAKPQLSISPVYLTAVNPSPHEVQTQDKVIIKCKLSSSQIVHITASVKDTVAELREKIASYKKDQQLTQFKLRSGTIFIDDTQSSRCLIDFGIKPGTTIEAQVGEFNLKNDSDKNISYISPTGLKNRRNSCFMNSALQCLVHVMPLTQYFLESIDRIERNVNNLKDSYGEVTAAYVELLCKFQRTEHSNKAFLPSRLRRAISRLNPSFATEDPQDAQEFLNLLLETIHEELQSNNQSNRKTIIEKLFVGKIESMITCLQCYHDKKNIEKLQILSLPLTRQQREFTIEFHSKKGHQSQTNVLVFASGRIEHLVKAFVDQRGKSNLFDRIVVQTTETEDSLDFSSPLYMLTDSKVRLIKQKKPFIRTQPIQVDIDPNKITLYECLQEFISIEYLKDAWFCEEMKCDKETKATKQFQLCTLPPVLIIQLKRFAFENGVQKKVKTFVKYPIDGLDLRDPSTSPHAIYDLIAVSNHIGSMRSGHYTAFARQKVPSDQWYKFDDAIVSTVSSESEIVTADAYLLFYMKRNYRIKQ